MSTDPFSDRGGREPYDEWSDSPYLCSGCSAVRDEPCLLGCVEAELRLQLGQDFEDESLGLTGSDLDAISAPFVPRWPETEDVADALFGPCEPLPTNDEDEFEIVPESHRVDPLQEAAAELSLAQRGLDKAVERMTRSLRPAEIELMKMRFQTRADRPASNVIRLPDPTVRKVPLREIIQDWQAAVSSGGASVTSIAQWSVDRPLPVGTRSCRWCHEIVVDDFDHDLCEPDEPTEPHLRRGSLPPEHPEGDGTRRWRDSLLCIHCHRWHPVRLIAPAGAAERNVSSALTVTCACGMHISVAHSWRRQCVVGLRYESPSSTVPPKSRC